MFNIGALARNIINPYNPILLTSRLLGPVSYPQIVFYSDGRMDIAGVGFIENQWYSPGQTVDIGQSYQIRFTLQAGEGPVTGYSDLVTTSWSDIFTPSYSGKRITWDTDSSGRVLVEIRDKATQVVKASAQFWSYGSSAP